MKKYNYLSLIIILLFFFIAPSSSFANYKGTEKDGGKKRTTLNKTTADPQQSIMNINGCTMWVTDYGFHDWVVGGGWNGAFPTGTHVGAIFAEGLVWGGQVTDGSQPVVRVNGNTYQSGTTAITRLFRVRPDYATANLASDAATYNDIDLGQVSESQIQEIRDQYAKDWAEWPADEGAMYEDVDGDGVYNPDVDIPGIPGAAQTIFIKYDDRNSASNYGSAPIGLEVREHYWAYAYSGALGNVIYKKVDFVYKGTATSAPNSRIDSLYIVQWADPDVGTSSDDFAGCDTTINMGYAYSSKATDATYAGLNLPPPAAGYDFLQGVSVFTGNPNDSAIFDLKWRKGYKYVNSKPMSSFVYFAAGGAWGDPSFNYNGTLEFYNLMRGKLPIPRYPSAVEFPENVVDYTSDGGVYLLAGDPVTGTGKIDGNVEGPGDRRIMVTNGPVSLRLGDTAQVVVGLVYGMGTDNLTSVTALKKNDVSAQIVFDQLFQLPNIPPPVVQVGQFDKKVTLDWGNDQESIEKIENFSSQDYTFEGYEVYQMPSVSSSIEDGIVLATYDLVDGVTAIYDTEVDANGVEIPVLTVNGTDAGIQRYMTITQDKFRKTDLRNGQAYYFAVVSYAYNPAPLLPFHALRSAVNIYQAVPQTNDPGARDGAGIGDTLTTTRVAGGSDGSVTAIVIDPSQLTGLKYTVSFEDTDDGTVWNVDRSDGVRVLANQTDQDADAASPIADGIQFKVKGAPYDFVNFIEVSNANGPHDPTYASFTFNSSGFPNGDFGPDVDRPDLNAGGVRWGIQTGPNGQYDYTNFKNRVERNDNWTRTVPYDFEIRFTAAGGKGDEFVQGEGFLDVPFELWNIGIGTPDDPSDDYRMLPLLYDYDGNGDWGISSADHPISGGDNDPATDWIYWYNPVDMSPGSAGYDDFANNSNEDAIGDEVMARIVFVSMNGGSVSDPTYPANLVQQVPETGTTFRFLSTKPNAPVDVFEIQAPANTYDASLAVTDVEKINVFPNPYYGYQYRETATDIHYVTFSHLPDDAVIRVFDLSGVLVSTINHNPINGQFERWNLQNQNNYPVASGIYVVYIDMPGLGTTKILKLAVIQEQQMLKVY